MRSGKPSTNDLSAGSYPAQGRNVVSGFGEALVTYPAVEEHNTVKNNFFLLISAASLLISTGCAGGGAAVKQLGQAATHFSITAQSSSTVGTAFNFTVTALDASGNVAAKYAGTVQVTSSDLQAVLSPPNSTLLNGMGTFSATMKTAGGQTITATDTVAASITGTSASIDVNASLGPHFSVTAPANDTAGISFNFTVTALDGANDVLPSYSGTVLFTSSDSQASLPVNSTLTNGTGSFSATMKTAGSQVVIATDTVTASMTGTSNPITVSHVGTTHFSVLAPTYVNSGTGFQLDVTALDAWNNVASSYSGMVHFTSSDGAAALPADSGFADGTGLFSVTLNTTGVQTVTATDTVASITGTFSATVIPAGTLVITSGQPPNGTVGSPYGAIESVCDTPPAAIDGFELKAAGGDIGRRSLTWVGSSLPPGLEITSVTLITSSQCYGTIWFIAGTPTTAGTFTFSVTASDSTANGSASYTITIANPQARAANHQEKSLLPAGRVRSKSRGNLEGENE